jgi:hypothetical protein
VQLSTTDLIFSGVIVKPTPSRGTSSASSGSFALRISAYGASFSTGAKNGSLFEFTCRKTTKPCFDWMNSRAVHGREARLRSKFDWLMAAHTFS